MMNLWPIQQNAIDSTVAAICDGEQSIVLTSPTGTGKSVVMTELIKHYAAQDWFVILYTNRKMLVEQLCRTLTAAKIDYGVRAAGYPDQRERPVQISSLQTENSRQGEGLGEWSIHGVGERCLVLIDEAHCNTGPGVQDLLTKHWNQGHVTIGVTATPIGLGTLYRKLIVAGKTSDGRKCGALVLARHFGPDEPDVRAMKAHKLPEGEDLSENQLRKITHAPKLFGRVWEWFEKLNPNHLPTILFASGVRESLWFAEQFNAKGVPAAHIDGNDVWRCGKLYRSSPLLRQEILQASKEGDLPVICNRFVLREGIDMPWLMHGIFATIFGSVQTYIQAGGRLLRNPGGGQSVTIQDHGGNWWRHGSLNSDRLWHLDDTTSSIYGKRANRIRKGIDREPFRCPQCAQIMMSRDCACGFQITVRSRPVLTSAGVLIELKGDIYQPRRVAKFQGAEGKWIVMYHRSAKMLNNPRTFRQAFALYACENFGQWPDPEWDYMPLNEADEYRVVREVPLSRLRRKAHAPV